MRMNTIVVIHIVFISFNCQNLAVILRGFDFYSINGSIISKCPKLSQNFQKIIQNLKYLIATVLEMLYIMNSLNFRI